MVDASPVGLGAVLIQVDKRGPRIIAYGNKSLSDCEKRYCQTEKEALALVWGVEHFRIYLYGKEFELITDHKPLEVIFGPKSKPCARIERWVLRLQSFRYKIIYKPGKSNIADPFSRLCCDGKSNAAFDNGDYVHQIIQYARPIAVSLKDIEKYSGTDEEMQLVKKGVFTNTWNDLVKCYKIFQSELCFCGNILLRGTRLVIPPSLRKRVLEAAHEGHPGIVAMKNGLRTKVWWPKIDGDAEKMVRSCRGCTLVSAPNKPNPMKRRTLPSGPWVDLAMDFMGPLPSGDYIFVIIDYFSRYKEIKIMKNITAISTVNTLREIFSRLGFPSSITSDNGKQFSSEEMNSFCKENNIILYNTIPYWPQQNGEVERQNRDILKRLKISQATKQNWKRELLDYLVMYNSTPHSVTGKTPSELFFNRQFRDKLPNPSDIEMRPDYEDVRDKDKVEKENGKEYGDRKRGANINFEIQPGDKVYLKNLTKENKLTPNFSPATHTVISKNGGDLQVRDDETGQEHRRNIIHLKKVEGEWKVCHN